MRNAVGHARQMHIGRWRTVARDDFDSIVIAKLALQIMQQIHQTHIHRIHIARIMVAQHVVDLGHGARVILAVAPVIDVEPFVRMQIVKGEGPDALDVWNGPRRSRHLKTPERSGQGA